jgi:photosystem II stability/assembly factor-like uncharacterized protein
MMKSPITPWRPRLIAGFEPRRFGILKALLALSLASLGFTACTSPKATPSETTTTMVTSPTTTEPSTSILDDLSWISNTHGWALVGQSQCETCSSPVLTTTNGGASWTQVGSLPSIKCGATCGANGPGASHIRFANADDGYAFDPDLFVTTDQGRSWSQEKGPQVTALEIVGSNVIRLSFSHSGCPGPCDVSVDEATVGSLSWRQLFAVPMQGDSDAVQLVRQGPDDVYVAVFQNPAGGAQSAQTFLYLSHDGGTTWNPRSDPCGYSGPAENDTVSMAAAPGGVLAALCITRIGTGPDFVTVSSNGGTTFAATAPLPAENDYHLIAVTSADDIFVATALDSGSRQFLEASSDGGSRWARVANGGLPDPALASFDPGFLGFESSNVGRWVGSLKDIWTTTDGGARWLSSPI